MLAGTAAVASTGSPHDTAGHAAPLSTKRTRCRRRHPSSGLLRTDTIGHRRPGGGRDERRDDRACNGQATARRLHRSRLRSGRFAASSVARARAPSRRSAGCSSREARLAPRASGWLDPAADPDPGPSAEIRACGEHQVSARGQRGACLRIDRHLDRPAAARTSQDGKLGLDGLRGWCVGLGRLRSADTIRASGARSARRRRPSPGGRRSPARALAADTPGPDAPRPPPRAGWRAAWQGAVRCAA